MKATVLDLRRRMPDVLKALDRNEPVTLLHRGKVKGVITPRPAAGSKTRKVADHPAFGLWKDRKDLQDVDRHVRNLRKGRGHAL
jgi:hypothetical protein